MTIVHCPKCREEVTLPKAVRSGALVRCPLCKEEFRLYEALTQLPPELIVVADSLNGLEPEEDADLASAQGARARPEPVGLAVPRWADNRTLPQEDATEGNVPAFQLDERGAGTLRTAARSPSAARMQAARLRRKQPNPLWQFVKIALGGVVGIALAQLILWWIPLDLPLSNRDLTGFGRKFGHYVPFLVPASIRETRLASAGQASSSSTGNHRRNSSLDARGKEIPRFPFATTHLKTPTPSPTSPRSEGASVKAGPRHEVLPGGNTPAELPPEVSARNAATGARQPKPPLPENEPAPKSLSEELARRGSPTPPKPPTVGLPTGSWKGSKPVREPRPGQTTDQPAPALPPGDIPKIEIQPPPKDALQPMDQEQIPRSAMADAARAMRTPAFPANDVLVRFSNALSANAAWDVTEQPDVRERRTLAAEFYSCFAALGEALVRAEQSDKTVCEKARDTGELLHKIGRQAEKLELIATVTASWLDNPRPHNGVLLLGQVQSVKAAGAYAALELQLASRDQRTVTLLSRQDQSPPCKVNDQLLLVGLIADEPEDYLAGSENTGRCVVVEGAHTVLRHNRSSNSPRGSN